MNDYSVLSQLHRDLYDSLQYSALSKINPIFGREIYFDANNKRIYFSFPICNFQIKFEGNNSRFPLNNNNYYWYYLGNTILKYDREIKSEEQIKTKNKYEVINTELPYYIQFIGSIIRKYYKKNIITFEDKLPTTLKIYINLEYNLELNLYESLYHIAENIFQFQYDPTIDLKIKEISKEKKPLENKILNIFDIAYSKKKITEQINFSYCINCGRNIKDSQKFCTNSGKYRNNCLNSFNNKLRRKLEIEKQHVREKLREKYFFELQSIINKYPFSAYEIFRRNNMKLFSDNRRN